MAVQLHPIEPTFARIVHVPTPSAPKTPVAAQTPSATTTATATATSATQTTEAPSFTAVFAQIAAAAAAAGTTQASIAPPPGSSAPPTVITPATSAAKAATTTPATLSATPATTAADDTTTGTDGPAGPLFGPNPWMTDPTGQGPNGYVTHYNPVYFATPQTAQIVANMLGGKVVQSVQITTAAGSPFGQDQLNNMVQLPNGGLVNPGFIADIYSHGWNQQFIDQQVAAEVAGATPAPIAT